ncbi:hypothetical protein Q9L58_006543 [Maublancomyces gigas]|uniref:BTB domain-containing protein n=1 Tax=Discina gigas TaxID=1032678 RepID=A0ABR3GEX9_9PEZI
MEFFTTEFRGNRSETQFVDFPPSGDLANSTISKIVIQHDDNVFLLQVLVCVYYSWNHGAVVTHGYTGNGSIEMILLPDEFIISIEGRATGEWIKQITFVTTKRRWGPHGGMEGEPFEWGSPAPGARIIALNGTTCQHFLRGLQATFGVKREKLPKTILYEPLSMETTPACDSCSEVGTLISVAKFRSHLMNPVITLSVGEEGVKYHVHEDTLCKLPFFKAALQGKFKEASEKAIAMPEDGPGSVAALIEFLYTGNYTYSYDPTKVQIPEGSTIPAGDFTEGLYHIGVYTVASKYDCKALSGMAVKNFSVVAVGLDNDGAFRLWKVAYSDGLRLSQCKESFAKYDSGGGLVSWAKWLFDNYGDGMEETFDEFPQLAGDLLRVAIGIN